MIHTIGQHTFELIESLKMRHTQGIMKVSKSLEKGEIDEIEMAVQAICVCTVSINGDTDSSKWKDFILDNLDPTEFETLSNLIKDIGDEFVKKNKILSMNMKPSSIVEDDHSL